MGAFEDHPCGHCGKPMTRNPHPDAGLPSAVLEIGPMYVCIPCTVRGRHKAVERYQRAEAERSDAEELLGEAMGLLGEHQKAHGVARTHECSCDRVYQPECPTHENAKAKVAQGWRVRRDIFLNKVGS